MRTVSKISDEELAGFLASTPPRRYIPPSIQRAVMRQAAPYTGILFGLLFGGIGLTFAAMFTPWNLPDDLRLRDAPTVPGVVEAVTPTRLSMNQVSVMQLSFSYQPPSSGKQVGECYTTGNRWKVGDRVSVRYLRDNPAVSRIEGSRRSPTEASGLITWIFPIVGFLLVMACLRTRRKIAHLLQHGALMEGTVTAVTRTLARTNKQQVYSITLQRANAEPIVLRRHQPSLIAFARQRMESKQPVFLLYDPKNPKFALLPESF